MWWMGLALFVVCIIEVRVLFRCSCITLIDVQRPNLDKVENLSWFTIFNICQYNSCQPSRPLLITFCLVFELVSAYGTVGLSLGVPYVRVELLHSFLTKLKSFIYRLITPFPVLSALCQN